MVAALAMVRYLAVKEVPPSTKLAAQTLPTAQAFTTCRVFVPALKVNPVNPPNELLSFT